MVFSRSFSDSRFWVQVVFFLKMFLCMLLFSVCKREFCVHKLVQLQYLWWLYEHACVCQSRLREGGGLRPTEQSQEEEAKINKCTQGVESSCTQGGGGKGEGEEHPNLSQRPPDAAAAAPPIPSCPKHLQDANPTHPIPRKENGEEHRQPQGPKIPRPSDKSPPPRCP